MDIFIVVDWTQGGGRIGKLRWCLAGPNSSLSIAWMTTESGSLTTEVVNTDNLVAASHQDKHQELERKLILICPSAEVVIL